MATTWDFPTSGQPERDDERAALEARYAAAVDDVARRGCHDVLTDFENAVRTSKAVICRPLGKASELLSSDNALYVTFYSQVRAGSRLPENNEFDRMRGPIDQTVFPHYAEKICFATLSLDGLGPMSYGPCCIVLKDAIIADRATVFEENSVTFCHGRVGLGDRLPMGFRATWPDRQKLAATKLHGRIGQDTTQKEFAGILLTQGGTTDTDDFIEVHIFGPIHRRGVESVVVKEPRRKEDKVLLRSLKRKLAEVGVQLETVS